MIHSRPGDDDADFARTGAAKRMAARACAPEVEKDCGQCTFAAECAQARARG